MQNSARLFQTGDRGEPIALGSAMIRAGREVANQGIEGADRERPKNAWAALTLHDGK